jgi:uncharacterized protein (DUF4415 family)
MPRKPSPELLNEEAPEATRAWFERAKPAREVLTDIVGKNMAQKMLRPKRGRPFSETPKTHVNI